MLEDSYLIIREETATLKVTRLVQGLRAGVGGAALLTGESGLTVPLREEGRWLPFPLNKDLPRSVPSLTVGANTPTACCFSFVSRQIPRKFVDDYYETSSQCSKPGIM